MRGDFGRLVMHAGGNLQDNCVVHGFPDTDTVLEEDAHIGHGAILHGCIIRRNALVGMSAVIMDGAEIGEDSFVAALAFVKAGFKLPPRKLLAGIPGKILRDLTQQEIDWKIQGTREIPGPDQALALDHARDGAAHQAGARPQAARPVGRRRRCTRSRAGELAERERARCEQRVDFDLLRDHALLDRKPDNGFERLAVGLDAERERVADHGAEIAGDGVGRR